MIVHMARTLLTSTTSKSEADSESASVPAVAMLCLCFRHRHVIAGADTAEGQEQKHAKPAFR